MKIAIKGKSIVKCAESLLTMQILKYHSVHIDEESWTKKVLGTFPKGAFDMLFNFCLTTQVSHPL